MRFDDLLKDHLGEFGRYQRRIYLLVCIPTIISAFHKLVWVFLGAVPLHRCLVPEDLSYNQTTPFYHLPPEVLNQTIPWDSRNLQFNQCEMFWTNNQTMECDIRVYDKTQYESTVVSEFELVCSKKYQRAMVHSFYSLGEMLGALVIGSVSDRIGRRKVLIVCLIGVSITGILAGLINNFYAFLVLRMLVGICAQSICLITFIIGVEFVGPSKRMFAGIIINYFFALGYVGVAAMAYWIRSWQMLQIAVSVPAIVVCIIVRWVPESARWLISAGRTEEALVIIKKVARENKKTLPPFEITDKKEEITSANPLELLRNASVRYKLLVISYCWFVNSAVYYGLSLNTSNLGGNDYLNFLLSALIEFPAYTICLLTMDRVGRRPVICVSMVLGGACLMGTLFVPVDQVTVTTTLAMLGKLGITTSYSVVFLAAAEIYPTRLRNAAIGINSVCSRIGSITTSFTVLLADYWRPLPLIILGAMSCSAGLLTLLLPETKGKALPETMDDVVAEEKHESEKCGAAMSNGCVKELQPLTNQPENDR